MPPKMEEARRRIAEAKAERATGLDLRGLDLTELPPEVYELRESRVRACGRAGSDA